MKNLKKQSGFTVIEVLIVITAISLIAGVAAISMAKGKTSAESNTESEKVAQIIREAQSRSQTAQLGKSWAVRCNTNTVDLLSINPENIVETYELPSRISCNSSNDIVFDKLTGIPVQDTDWFIQTDATDSSRIEVRIPGIIKTISL